MITAQTRLNRKFCMSYGLDLSYRLNLLSTGLECFERGVPRYAFVNLLETPCRRSIPTNLPIVRQAIPPGKQKAFSTYAPVSGGDRPGNSRVTRHVGT